MGKINSFLGLGKLKHELLNKMLKIIDSSDSFNDNRVVLGSKIGEDAAVIDMGEKYLVAKTDPITFATDEIGYYAVNVNVNDLACTGATPKWFQSTILLPEKKTNDDLIETIFRSIHETCKSMNITVVGGHTEVTSGLNRPIVVGSLFGEVEKDKLVKTEGAEPGDSLILTKGIFIEGTSIIGREKEKELKKHGYDSKFINKCKQYLFEPGISVYKEALLANNNFKIKAMHDPTEGGLACGIMEMTMASNTGVLIEESKIKILSEPAELSKIFQINPMNTISSGSLLIAINKQDSKDLVELLRKNKIFADIIGDFVPKKQGNKIINMEKQKKQLEYTETDEITKLF